MANIRDVAHLAGVSVSSVSNVLNGRSNQMRPETRLRIEQVMRELNYQPNRVAQQLKTGHARMIGLLVPRSSTPAFLPWLARLTWRLKNTATGCCWATPIGKKMKSAPLSKICSPMGARHYRCGE
ncbi:Catabolite control protein B [Serratia fonticola]|uniref:Catabolite control protein B n=1 Tax=Serratia fonticola TaxID=47917 RepID=A0A4U9W639_SERFO|nr:Catabolite control protein B [Serratia fonticola]